MQADAEQEMESIENKKSEKDSLEKAANEWIRPLKEGSLEGEEHKEAAKQLTELLRELCEEETMLACLERYLPKKVADRTEFDEFLFEQLDVWVTKFTGRLADKISSAAPGMEKAAAKKAAAQAEIDAATKQLDELKEAIDKTNNAVVDGAGAARTARKASTNWLTDLKKMYSEIDDLTGKLKDFNLGPELALQELKSMTTPV